MKLKTMHLLAPVLGVAFITVLAGQSSVAQEHKAINLSPARGLPFSDGVVAGNTL
jgi:hypothetical protein